MARSGGGAGAGGPGGAGSGAGGEDASGPPAELAELLEQLEAEMRAASEELRFEEAAMLRDELIELRLSAGIVDPLGLSVDENDEIAASVGAEGEG